MQVKRCPSCKASHEVKPSRVDSSGRGGSRAFYVCPNTGKETSALVSKAAGAAPVKGARKVADAAERAAKGGGGPAREAARAADAVADAVEQVRPEAKPQRAQRRPQQAQSANGGGNMKRTFVLEVDGQPVIDWDDAQLYQVAQGIVAALPTVDGRGAQSVRALQSEAATVAARASAAAPTAAQSKEEREREHRMSLGRELARHILFVLVNAGVGWDSVRPAVLDTRSTAETITDGGINMIGGAIAPFVPDVVDIYRPGGVGVGEADNVGMIEQGLSVAGQALDLFNLARAAGQR